jgi:hypothetical protein
MKDPRLMILNLLKKYWSLNKPSREEIVWVITPYNSELAAPQISITDADVDHKLIASNLYQVKHNMKIGIYVKGAENQKTKFEMKEEVKKIIVNHPNEVEDINYVFLGNDWKDVDDLKVKPALLGVEGTITAVYFVVKIIE